MFVLTNKLILLVGTGIIGCIVGSFINVVIYRLPIILKHEDSAAKTGNKNHTARSTNYGFNIIQPRSHCPHCKKLVLWWQNIPVFSYLILKGRCHNCNALIHWRYPTVELLATITSIFVVANFGFNFQALALLIVTWTLIAAIFIDLEHQILPDQITLPLLWLGLLVNTTYTFTTPENAILGAVFGYFFLWFVAKLFKLIRKIDGMGYGDFKLVAAFGAWLGWRALPTIVLSASLAALAINLLLVLTKKRKFSQAFPFGPYLATAGWIAFFMGPQTLSWLNYFNIGV